MQAPCGCEPVFEPHERNPQLEGINFCPLHAAAPKLLVELKRIVKLLEPALGGGTTVPDLATLNKAWLVIAKAEER